MPRALKIALAWGAGAVLVGGAFALARRRRRISPHLLAWLPIWIPVGASCAAAVLLIRPRDHYLVPLCFFANATLASACGALSRRRSPRAVYAGIPFRWIPKGEKDGPFSDFLRQHDIDVVIASPSLLDDARFRDDPAFRSFLADDGDHRGFILTRVPRSRTIIAVRPK